MAVKQSPSIQLIEEKYEKPLADVLMMLYAEHQSLTKVGEILGVDQSTISHWLIREKLVIRRALAYEAFVPSEKARPFMRDMRDPYAQEGENVPHLAGVSQ